MISIRWPTVGLLALSLALASASPAEAAKRKHTQPSGGGESCYSQSEFEADQILELHTEMMVIGLKCRSAYPAENPFGVYHDFTRSHRSLLGEAERRMIDFFRRQGGRGATQQFDTFRTELANQVSRRAALIGETAYCAVMVPLVVQTPALSDAGVHNLIADVEAPHLTRSPPCATGRGAAKMQ